MNTPSDVEALASLIGNKMILRTSTAEIAQAVLDAGYSKGGTATPDPAGVSGASLIAAERRRQYQVEGYSIEHDMEHGPEILMAAALAYTDSEWWPWELSLFKPRDWLSNRVRAGALYQAAQDVIDAGVPLTTIRSGPAELRDQIIRDIDTVLAALPHLSGPAVSDAVERLTAENEQLREAVNRQHGEPIDEVYNVDGITIVMEQIHTLRRERDAALNAVEKAKRRAWDEGVSDADAAWKSSMAMSFTGREQIASPYRTPFATEAES